MVDIVSIYALTDPRDNSIRYVGKTRRTLKERLQKHLTGRRKESNHKARWINKLVRSGIKPSISLLEEVPYELWQEAERYWITFFKGRGADLTNSTNGGEDDVIFNSEVLVNRGKKISAAKKGRPNGKKGIKMSAEYSAKLSARMKGKTPWNKGVPASPEVRANLSAILKGKPGRNKGTKFSAQARANLSAAHKGKKLSPERAAKMREYAMRRWHPEVSPEQLALPL